MITVTFKQEEANFLLEEFGIEVDSNLQFVFTKERAAEIRDICLDIDNEEYAGGRGNFKRGDIATDVYYTIQAAWPKGDDWLKYLKTPTA